MYVYANGLAVHLVDSTIVSITHLPQKPTSSHSIIISSCTYIHIYTHVHTRKCIHIHFYTYLRTKTYKLFHIFSSVHTDLQGWVKGNEWKGWKMKKTKNLNNIQIHDNLIQFYQYKHANHIKIHHDREKNSYVLFLPVSWPAWDSDTSFCRLITTKALLNFRFIYIFLF